MYQESIIVNGREYILQHPGNRAVQNAQNSALKVVDDGIRLNSVPLMDFCFEHVVIPKNGSPKLSVDGYIRNGEKPSIANTTKEDFIAWQKEYTEVWVRILPSFLRGDLETYVFQSSDFRTNTSQDINTETVETPSQQTVQTVATTPLVRRRVVGQRNG